MRLLKYDFLLKRHDKVPATWTLQTRYILAEHFINLANSSLRYVTNSYVVFNLYRIILDQHCCSYNTDYNVVVSFASIDTNNVVAACLR